MNSLEVYTIKSEAQYMHESPRCSNCAYRYFGNDGHAQKRSYCDKLKIRVKQAATCKYWREK